MQRLPVKIKKLDERAVIPSYAKPGDAGLDLIAIDDGNLDIINDHNGAVVTYDTGLAVEIPEGFVGLVYPRSSLASKTCLMLSNGVGVIDSGYRGSIKIKFRDFTPLARKGSLYKAGDRIAQLMIVPYPVIEFEEVDNLSDTDRGDGGFGSTGE